MTCGIIRIVSEADTDYIFYRRLRVLSSAAAVYENLKMENEMTSAIERSQA